MVLYYDFNLFNSLNLTDRMVLEDPYDGFYQLAHNPLLALAFSGKESILDYYSTLFFRLRPIADNNRTVLIDFTPFPNPL